MYLKKKNPELPGGREAWSASLFQTDSVPILEGIFLEASILGMETEGQTARPEEGQARIAVNVLYSADLCTKTGMCW